MAVYFGPWEERHMKEGGKKSPIASWDTIHSSVRPVLGYPPSLHCYLQKHIWITFTVCHAER